MKRFIRFIESIRNLSEIDVEQLRQEDFKDLWAIKELEDILREFYMFGYNDQNLDVDNRISNFYLSYVNSKGIDKIRYEP